MSCVPTRSTSSITRTPVIALPQFRSHRFSHSNVRSSFGSSTPRASCLLASLAIACQLMEKETCKPSASRLLTEIRLTTLSTAFIKVCACHPVEYTVLIRLVLISSKLKSKESTPSHVYLYPTYSRDTGYRYTYEG